MIKFVLRTISFIDRWFGYFRFKFLVRKSGIGSFYNSRIYIKYGENIEVGDRVRIGRNTSLGAAARITIQDDVTISAGVLIETSGLQKDLYKHEHYHHEIVIKKFAWIGANAIILGGVTIGEHAIIGAGAIVSKSVDDYQIVVSAKNRIIN